VVEATALRDLQGTALADSFFNTTFNAPVIHMAEGFKYIAYTWGLRGEEGTGVGGNFPDAAIAKGLGAIPPPCERARLPDMIGRTETWAPNLNYVRVKRAKDGTE